MKSQNIKQKMTPEQNEFVTNLDNAYSSLAKVLFSWEKLSNDDSQAICDGYPFTGSFDEWLAEYAIWIQKVKNIFESRFLSFSPTVKVKDLKEILETLDDDTQIVVADKNQFWWSNIDSVELPDGEGMFTLTFHTSYNFDLRQLDL